MALASDVDVNLYANDSYRVARCYSDFSQLTTFYMVGSQLSVCFLFGMHFCTIFLTCIVCVLIANF